MQRPQSASVHSRRPSSSAGRARAAVADSAADLLGPKPGGPEYPNHVILRSRRPNTAGLRQHAHPWTLDKLQTMVTRNGIGCATWRSTMRELSTFSRGLGSFADDISEGEEDAQGAQEEKQIRPAALAKVVPQGAGEPPAVSRLAAAGRFPIAEVPREAVLMKMLRSLSALESAMQASGRASVLEAPPAGGSSRSGAQGAALAVERASKDLRSVIVERPELHRNDTRAPGVSVKVVHRHTMIDACRASTYDRAYANDLLDCFQAFSGGESVVMVGALDLALEHLLQRSALSMIHLLFYTLKSLKAPAFRAELYAAERTVSGVAVEAQRAETKLLEEHQRNSGLTAAPQRRKSFSLPTSPTRRLKGLASVNGLAAAAELSHLVESVLQPRRRGADTAAIRSDDIDGATIALVAVDSVTWKDLRAAILTSVGSDGESARYPKLSSLVMQHNL